MTDGLVLLDGCGDGDRDLAVGWSRTGITAVGTDAGSFSGGYGIRLGHAPFNGYGGATRSFANQAHPLIGFHWHIVAASPYSGERPLVWLRKDGVTHCQVAVDLDGSVNIYGPSGALVAQSDPDTILYGTWYSVEIDAVIHDTTGHVKVYLGGHPDTPVVEFTGDTKHASASAFINQVQWWNGEAQRVYLDDLFVVDLDAGDRVGVGFVQSFPLDSDEETDWTPSTGSTHYTLVDERPFSATDYVSTDGAGNRDRFGINDGGNVEPVLGARVVGRMQGDSGAQSRFVFSDGSTHATGATRSLGAAATYEDVFTEPPAGGAWGASSGLQPGVECVTGAGPVSRLNGIALELLLRRPPGEVRFTHFEVMAGTTQEPGPAAVTHEAASFSGTDDPSEVRVTHEYVDISGTDAPSAVRVTHLYVQALMDNEPIPPPLPTLQGCDLLLEVFNDDRETVRWSCSTRLEYSNPYLMMPERYAEQEIDVAEGSATLGTVTVMVVDVPQEAGDQATGFLTGKLARQAVADVQGRRARLLRAIGTAGVDQILEVVIDGVAGTPRMDTSYAAFGFEIRDTREVERKIRCFDGAVEHSTALLPNGVLESYGLNPETGLYLLDAVGPLTGTFNQQNGTYPNPATGSVDLTGNPLDDRTIPLAVHSAMFGTVAERGPLTEPGVYSRVWYRTRFPNVAIWWREAGSGDPWSIIDGAHLVLDGTATHPRTNLATVTNDVGDDLVEIEWITFGDDRVAPAGLAVPVYSPANPDSALPAHGQSIELIIVGSGPASASNPVHIEGMTAGEFARNVYDGLYSPRDADGNVVPTGILYDETALLAMTDLVRMRITEPVKDARDWLEKYIYAPTGWVPALDIYGRISPVSQEAPDDIYSLPLIYDEITEPAPTWDAGQHIVNVVRFTNYRDFVPDETSEPETLDGLSDNTNPILEFRDPVSVERNGEQIIELDGRAFRALGDSIGEPVLEGGLQAELGYQLALERRDHVLNRYSLGAPTMTVNVRREYTPTLRAGSWVRVWLSWFPDYVTGERGLIALCQIVAIGDLDCVWRMVTMEQVIPLSLYDVDDDLRSALLVGKTGKFLTGKSGLPLTSTL